mgnify:CR=1 FL=1
MVECTNINIRGRWVGNLSSLSFLMSITILILVKADAIQDDIQLFKHCTKPIQFLYYTSKDFNTNVYEYHVSLVFKIST